MKTNWNWSHPLLVLTALCLVKSCSCDESEAAQQTVVKEVSSVVEQDNPLWHFEIRNSDSKGPELQLLRRLLAQKSTDKGKRFLSGYLENENLNPTKRFDKDILQGKRDFSDYEEEESPNPLAKRDWESILQEKRVLSRDQEEEVPNQSEKRELSAVSNGFQKRLWKGLIPSKEDDCAVDDCELNFQKRVLRIWKGIMGLGNDEARDEDLKKRLLENEEHEEDKRIWKNIMGNNQIKRNWENIFEDYESF